MIPTAEQLMQANNGDDYTHYEEIHKLMIEFAKLHVKAALEVAAKDAEVLPEPRHQPDLWQHAKIDKDSILNAYPESNIK